MMTAKECTKRWRERNKEHVAEKQKEWNENNKEKRREYNKKWRENNKQLKSEIDKKWRENNKERCLKNSRKWRKNNPKKASEYYISNREMTLKKKHEYYLTNKNKIKENISKRRKENPETYGIIGRRFVAKRRRELGYNPLNAKFLGSVGHHINKNDVIYIPEQLHRSIPHRQGDEESMREINQLAINWYNEQLGDF